MKFSDDHTIWLSNKKYDPNTIKKHFSTLKTFLNHYFKRRDIYKIGIKADFLMKEFGESKTHFSPPLPLTNTEFLQLYFDQHTDWQRKLSKDEIKVKDMMLLQCSTGLRYSDLFRIVPSKIKNNIIFIEPVKTERTKKDNLCKIPINYFSKHILERYKWNTTDIRITNQQYNKQIKIVAEVMKFNSLVEKKEYNGLGDIIEKSYPKHQLLSSHNMRDTFITLCVKSKIDIPTIMKYVGQSSWEVMQKYVKLDDNHLIEQMENFNNITSDIKVVPTFIANPEEGEKINDDIVINDFESKGIIIKDREIKKM
jgi:site-specific recombinase XerD